MAGWDYMVIVAGALLLLITCYKEHKRRNKKNLPLRLIAIILATAGLTLLGLNISYKQTVVAENSVIIITDGYNKDSVQFFKEAANKNLPAYTFEDFIASGKSNYKSVHVFGYGLSADELKQLHNIPVIFHPQAIGTGITSIHWQQALHTGEKLQVQGSFNNTANTPVKLILNGLNTMLDSVTIGPNKQQPFQLSAVPKQSGKAVYNITAVAGDKVIEDELLPVEVTAADSLKVLILAASPDFEDNFLKNWLSQNSYQVVVRNTTSKDKYDRSFLNTATANIDKITASTLTSFDVLITDAAAFAALSKDEQTIIQTSVLNGLGMIIKTDTTLPSSSFYAQTFPVYSQPHKVSQNVMLQLTGAGTLHGVTAEQLLYIRPQPGTQALTTDSSAQVLVNSAVYGAGKIAVTTYNNTYSWMLNGNKDDYYAFWSTLLNKVAKGRQQTDITLSPAVPVVNHPLHLTFTSNINPQPVIGESPVYLQQSVHLPFEWSGTYWPVQTGWQIIKMQNDSASFYVYSADDWQIATAVTKTNATQQYVQQQQFSSPVDMLQTTEDVPVNKVYFFILLLVCCTYLWVERKFNG